MHRRAPHVRVELVLAHREAAVLSAHAAHWLCRIRRPVLSLPPRHNGKAHTRTKAASGRVWIAVSALGGRPPRCLHCSRSCATARAPALSTPKAAGQRPVFVT
eukprot:Amastigsp_a176678_22.p6 type:complete len:103 gc:universal Amastigsp_a176678_22:1140-1448(+)